MAAREGVAGTVTYSPWHDLGHRYPGWVVRHAPLRGLHEVLCRRRRVILLEVDRAIHERRCDLSHALAHLDLNHVIASGVYSAREELAASKEAARRLISIPALADALLWSTHPPELAELLRVDNELLRLRLRYLHPAERHYLRRVVAEKDVHA